ncbi:hypothetical protein BURKHO8Y_120154 [Burkholderia sp. 8Y]|nr:hypothetical protein BURKHO8Y_120154 [Burkholderia sp. 8Y]
MLCSDGRVRWMGVARAGGVAGLCSAGIGSRVVVAVANASQLRMPSRTIPKIPTRQ